MTRSIIDDCSEEYDRTGLIEKTFKVILSERGFFIKSYFSFIQKSRVLKIFPRKSEDKFSFNLDVSSLIHVLIKQVLGDQKCLIKELKFILIFSKWFLRKRSRPDYYDKS